VKLFSCSSCKQVAFFENVQCLSCGYQLGFFTDHLALMAMEPVNGRWQACGWNGLYRKCANYEVEATCNWMVNDNDGNPLCL